MKLFTKLFCAAAMAMFAGCAKPEANNSANVPVNGGTFTVGGITIEIPEGAIDSPVEISAKIIKEPDGIKSLPYDALAMAEFGPERTIFNKNIKITIPVGKLPAGEKLAAYYYNEAESIWTVASEAKAGAGAVTFETNHFSLYAVGGHYDHVAESAGSLVDKVNAGTSDEAIFESFRKRIESRLTDLFSWDIIGGRYYRVERYNEDYYYDINGKEGQGQYQIGIGVPGWTGYHDEAASLFRYMSDTQSSENVDYDTYNKLKADKKDVYSTSFERELHLVPSVMTATLDGTLTKKGDKADVHFKLSAKTSGGKVSEYMVMHSCVGFTSGYNDTTPNGEYDKKIEIPDDDPSLGQNPPMAYQTIKVETTNSKAFKLSSSTLTTDEHGEAVVTVTALSDNPSGDIKGIFDFQYNHDTDHSEASVKIGGSLWCVTGILSDIRPESEFGVTASTDISFEFTFDPAKVEKVSMYGEKMEMTPAEFTITASNVSISNGHYTIPGLGGADYIISNITPKTLTGIKGFVTSQNGVMCAVASDPARPENPVAATYDILTQTVDGFGKVIAEESEPAEWPAPMQFSFPLKEGHYSPLVMTAANAMAAQSDKEHFYVMLMSGSLMAGADTATLTGDIVISRN